MAESSNKKRRQSRRLTDAVRNPHLALEKGWYRDPKFCSQFFGRCEDEAFVDSPRSMELAMRAVQIADANGDPHLHNRSVGLISNASLVEKNTYWAGKILDMNRDRAIGCCPLCRSDHLRRVGDVLLESRQPESSLLALSDSLDEGGRLLDADDLGRLYFVRSIAQHHRGNRDQALDDAGRTLSELPLDSPRGYFVDTPAFLAFFVWAGDPRHDRAALELLEAFVERIRGLRSWKDWRTRATWVAGQLRARLGHYRRARRHLETAFANLLDAGLEREVTAVTVDLVQLICRHHDPREAYVWNAQHLIGRCLRLREDLAPDHRAGLEQMKDEVLADWPNDAFDVLRSFRESLVSPVPGILGERLGSSRES